MGGEQRLAEIVALASSDRPVVFFEGPPDLTPWVSDADVKAKGAVFIWHAVDNVGTPPASLLSRFPDLVPEVPRSFQRAIEGRLPLLRIGWAVIRPALAQ